MKYRTQCERLRALEVEFSAGISTMVDELLGLGDEPHTLFLYEKLEALEDIEFELTGDVVIIGPLLSALQEELQLSEFGLTAEESATLPRGPHPIQEMNRIINQIKARRAHS